MFGVRVHLIRFIPFSYKSSFHPRGHPLETGYLFDPIGIDLSPGSLVTMMDGSVKALFANSGEIFPEDQKLLTEITIPETYRYYNSQGILVKTKSDLIAHLDPNEMVIILIQPEVLQQPFASGEETPSEVVPIGEWKYAYLDLKSTYALNT